MKFDDLEANVIICPNCQAKVNVEYLDELDDVEEFQECANCGIDYIVELLGSNDVGLVYQTYLMM